MAQKSEPYVVWSIDIQISKRHQLFTSWYDHSPIFPIPLPTIFHHYLESVQQSLEWKFGKMGGKIPIVSDRINVALEKHESLHRHRVMNFTNAWPVHRK